MRLAARLGQTITLDRKAQAVHDASDANLARANSGADELGEFRKQQGVSYVSVQDLTVELKEVKAKSVIVAEDKP